MPVPVAMKTNTGPAPDEASMLSGCPQEWNSDDLMRTLMKCYVRTHTPRKELSPRSTKARSHDGCHQYEAYENPWLGAEATMAAMPVTGQRRLFHLGSGPSRGGEVGNDCPDDGDSDWLYDFDDSAMQMHTVTKEEKEKDALRHEALFTHINKAMEKAYPT